MNIKSQIKNLKKLNLPTDQYVIVGSGALAIRGLREAKDLDVIVTQSLWDKMRKKYDVAPNSWGVECMVLPHDIETLNPQQSIFGNSKIVLREEIFAQAEMFDGVPFMSLEHLKKIKLELGREIDLKDVEMIDAYLDQERIASLLLSWDEYNKKEFDVPYVYSIKNDTQELLYVGTRHCYNPKDEEFEKVRKEWKEFYGRNKYREMIVVVEGGVRPVEESEEKAIIKGGEMNFITYLAYQDKVSIICFEPMRGEVFDELAKKHSKEKVFYQRMAQISLQWNTLTEKPEFEGYIKYFMKRDKEESDWTNFDFSFDTLKKIHTEIFHTEFNATDRDFFYSIINPSQKNTQINDISRDEDVVRDTAIIKGILNKWKEGKSIFVVYGSGHAVIQEPALRELLKTETIYLS